MSKHYYFNEGAVEYDCAECDEENHVELMWMSSPSKKKQKKVVIELVCEYCYHTSRVKLPVDSYIKHKDLRVN